MIAHKCNPALPCKLCSRAAKKPCGKPDCGCGCSEKKAAVAASLPRWQPVPPPALSPTRDRLILTAVIGDDAAEMHLATGPTHRRYAERVGADYVVLRDRTQDARMPCAEKWRAKDYVPHYPGGTLWLDADVFVMPDAPDIFGAVPADKVGLVNVAPRTGNLLAWSPTEYEPLCRSQGVPIDPRAHEVYWNSGVWVGRPDHASYWTPPPLPYEPKWCVEEHWCRRNVFHDGLAVHDLDPRFNWTWPEDRQFRTWAERRPWFAHLAGMGNMDVPAWIHTNREWRQALLRLLAAVIADPAKEE